MNSQPIVVERIFNASPMKIWQAFTDKSEMKKWYFELAEFKAEPGFKFQFTGGPKDGKQYLHLCEIKEVVKEKKISYSWRYDGYPGNSLVSFELSQEGNKTRLKLTHSDIETFGNENPDFAKENFIAGWTHIIHVSFKNYIEPIEKQVS
jgi:uncharacterized protein YndB with AHSA1/START domain